MAYQRTTTGSSDAWATPGALRGEALSQSTSAGLASPAINEMSVGAFSQIADDLSSDSLSPYDRFLASQDAAAGRFAYEGLNFGAGSDSLASILPSVAAYHAQAAQARQEAAVAPTMGLAAAPTVTPGMPISPLVEPAAASSLAPITLVSPTEGSTTPPPFTTGTLVSALPGSAATSSSPTGAFVSNTSTGPEDSANSAIALGADVASSLYGVTGAGLKIGIISNSFNATGGASADVAAGRLPANVTVLADGYSSDDEGRAMIEDAYSIAPGAQYYFATNGTTDGSFASAVTALQNAGCNIIIDDVTFFDELLYQSGGPADKPITAAINAGVNYFTSAGNSDSGFYEQGFKPLSVNIAGIGSVIANDFGGGSPYLNVYIPQGYTLGDILGWAQPSSETGGSGAQNTLAVYLLDSQGNIVSSNTSSTVGGNANELLYYTNTTNSSAFYRVVVTQNGGVVPAGELFKFVEEYQGTPFANAAQTQILSSGGSGTLVGHEFLAGVNSVGAVYSGNTPAFGVPQPIQETFSSDGPGEVLYDSAGNPLASPLIPDAPEFSAPDGTNFHSTHGIQDFYGTSAAAPAAGAVSALVLSANSSLSPAQITSILAQSTIPTNDTVSGGAGFIQARAAVEIGAADAGDRWNNANGGDWANANNWSKAAAPNASEGVSIDDNLGGFAGSYQSTVGTLGQLAGSVAVSAPQGSAAMLNIAVGGQLSVGGSKAANPTAGDLLTSDNGTLKVSGGTLTVTGSINNNNGVVTIGAGSATADNYTENAGQFTLGGGPAVATLTLTGGGFAMTGGTASVLALGHLTTSSLALADSILEIAGLVTDTGSATNGVTFTSSGLDLQGGGELDIGGSASGGLISFDGGGLLKFTSADPTILIGGLSDTIAGLGVNDGAVDFSGLAYSVADTLSYSSVNGSVDIFDARGVEIASVELDTETDYSGSLELQSDGLANHLELVALCFCEGTLISTDKGDVAVEALKIGDRVLTADGAHEPIRWIGHRSYLGDFIKGDPFVLPVCIKAGALGDAAPSLDLWVSPGHALYIDDQLVPAWRLINGVSIVQATSVETLTYYHVELSRHAILHANGAPAESFVDEGFREQFHNASAYNARYPNASPIPPMAPRLEAGFALQAIQRRINNRVSLASAARGYGPLRGFIDQEAPGRLCGWAQDVANPEEPVVLEVCIEGRPLFCMLANGYRADLRRANLGSGCHAFDVPIAATLFGQGRIDVRRVLDGASLLRTDQAGLSLKAA